LLTLKANNKDEIIMPSYVCSSPYFAIMQAGAKPKIVDIDSKDLSICARTAKKHLSFKTKAIIAPHMFGNPAELDELLNLGVPIIEDCAQALGAEYNKRRVGSLGDLSIFSFYATKMITTGEGGMVLTNNSEYYHRIIETRDYDKKPLTPIKYNYKMTDFQAALGLSQLKKLQGFINQRRRIAAQYTSQLSEHVLATPTEHAHKTSVYYRYVVMVDKLDEIQRKVKEKGVICEKPVWRPLHKDMLNLKCPNSEYAQSHALSIPLYPSLREEEVEHVARTLKAAFKKHLSS
jgi:dTDP-4-amino-4,6-dideoxygalactose transaminase